MRAVKAFGTTWLAQTLIIPVEYKDRIYPFQVDYETGIFHRKDQHILEVLEALWALLTYVTAWQRPILS